MNSTKSRAGQTTMAFLDETEVSPPSTIRPHAVRVVPHPIPYQGSKRTLASAILERFPEDVKTLIEPFAGSAAVSLAAAYHGVATRFLISDVTAPLIALWTKICD